MKSFTTWLLALIAVAGIAGFSGAWSSVQGGQGKQANPGKVQGKKANKGRAEKQAALKKVLPTLKTSLAEAIALAEKESSGKAYNAEVELLPKEGKPTIKVGLLVSDKFTSANVDPETKKVTLAAPTKEGEHPEGHPEGGDGDGDGDGEEGG